MKTNIKTRQRIQKSLKSRPFILGIIVFFILITLAIFFYINRASNTKADTTTQRLDNTTNVDSINLTPPSQEEQDNGNSAKKQSVETNDSGANNSLSSATISVTSSNQTDSYLQIRTQINRIESNGTCSLIMTKDSSNSIYRTVNTQALASTSTCMGFNIPLSDLSPGQWKVHLVYTGSLSSGFVDNIIEVE
ncbi:hypothetical protein HGB07_01125 [Candidatus Roizmanbacteria bacterium]|nr:hypothetical protein [Candidatus Roizmanbacteria bacterium]